MEFPIHLIRSLFILLGFQVVMMTILGEHKMIFNLKSQFQISNIYLIKEFLVIFKNRFKLPIIFTIQINFLELSIMMHHHTEHVLVEHVIMLLVALLKLVT